MAIQTTGQIDISDIVDEFGGTAPHDLSEYYGVDTGVPASGTISLSDFYGAANTALDPVSFSVGSGTWVRPSFPYLYMTVRMWGGGGGGAGGSDNDYGSGGGGGGFVQFNVFYADAPVSAPYTVGSGGAPGGWEALGLDGGSTTFLGAVAGGGQGGGQQSQWRTAGGTGGGVTNPTVAHSSRITEVGGAGGQGVDTGQAAAGQNRTYAGGGGGGSGETGGSIGGAGGVSTYGGNGGRGGDGNQNNGSVGTIPGGGGGGNDLTGGARYAGAHGRIDITYTPLS